MAESERCPVVRLWHIFHAEVILPQINANERK